MGPVVYLYPRTSYQTTIITSKSDKEFSVATLKQPILCQKVPKHKTDLRHPFLQLLFELRICWANNYREANSNNNDTLNVDQAPPVRLTQRLNSIEEQITSSKTDTNTSINPDEEYASRVRLSQNNLITARRNIAFNLTTPNYAMLNTIHTSQVFFTQKIKILAHRNTRSNTNLFNPQGYIPICVTRTFALELPVTHGTYCKNQPLSTTNFISLPKLGSENKIKASLAYQSALQFQELDQARLSVKSNS